VNVKDCQGRGEKLFPSQAQRVKGKSYQNKGLHDDTMCDRYVFLVVLLFFTFTDFSDLNSVSLLPVLVVYWC
jgi:hypothetical protein